MAEAPVVTLIRDLTFGASPWKPAVRALADSNVTRSGPQTIDGVALVRDQVVLLTAQTNATENGPWVVKDAAWTRPLWFDADSEIFSGATVYIAEGGTYAQQFWTLTTTTASGRIRLGFDNLTWDQRILGGGAPLDQAYWIDGTPDVSLTQAVNTRAVSTTLEVASTSTLPLASKRTDAATSSMVDVTRATALSGGTPLAGFGASCLSRAANGAGTAGDIGRTGFAWTDPAAGSEDSKYVIQARTGGAALATCVEVDDSGINMLGRSVTQCAAVTRGGGAIAVTAGAGALTMSGSTTASLAAGAAGLTLTGATDVTIEATADDVLITAGDAITATATGALAVSGATASVTASGGNATLDASAVVRVGPTLATRVELGRSGQTVRHPALAGGGTRYVTVDNNGDEGAATATGVPTTRVITAGAGLTGGGDLSADRTLDVVAADGTITVNADSIEASGNFGSKAILTDVGLDTVNAAVPLPIGTGNCGSIVLGQAGVPVTVEDALTVGSTATVNGTLTKTGTGLTTTRVVGIRAQNTSASTNVVTVQNGYLVVSEGTGWESGSSSSKTVGGGFLTIPVTSGTVGYQLRSVIDAGAGSYSLLADYYTNNDPGLGGTARVADTFVSANGNGFRFSTNGQGGVKQNGTAVMLTSGSTNEVQLGTNSTTRHAITNAGGVTQSLDSTATHRRQWGTAGRRYVDHASAVFTSDSSLGYETALTYTLPDNCVAEVIAIGNGLNTSTGDAAGYAKRRTVKRWSGGSATTVGSERDLGADNEDVVNWQMRINVSGNNVIIEVESDTAAVKWGIDIEVHITTSTA